MQINNPRMTGVRHEFLARPPNPYGANKSDCARCKKKTEDEIGTLLTYLPGQPAPAELYPADLCDQTTKLVNSYLQEEDTLVLCVADATIPSMDSSIAVKMVRDNAKLPSTILALTKADLIKDEESIVEHIFERSIQDTMIKITDQIGDLGPSPDAVDPAKVLRIVTSKVQQDSSNWKWLSQQGVQLSNMTTDQGIMECQLPFLDKAKEDPVSSETPSVGLKPHKLASQAEKDPIPSRTPSPEPVCQAKQDPTPSKNPSLRLADELEDFRIRQYRQNKQESKSSRKGRSRSKLAFQQFHDY
ncbi:hypothetical protein WJX79_006122 [Trebouxia sp. C0005]